MLLPATPNKLDHTAHMSRLTGSDPFFDPSHALAGGMEATLTLTPMHPTTGLKDQGCVRLWMNSCRTTQQ